MTISRTEELQRNWKQSGALAAIETALDAVGFSETYVSEFASSIEGKGKSKVIKDGVWGMIEVDPGCLRLLDSPLLQRMRRVRQLGFSYLTYPSAEHTRFIHSLGMYCVVSRFLDIIAHRKESSSSPSAPYDYWTPSETQARLLSHAAILHDIGHLPFSHVTERILQADSSTFKCGNQTVEEFLFIAEEALEHSPKLAEALSIGIILTDRFQRFYSTVVSPGSDPLDPLRLASLVAGLEPEAGLTGLASLISGNSIDADKIDYINRDATACGIPVGVDVSRLFLRSSFLSVKPPELQRLRSSDDLPDKAEVIFVVNASGLDSIEEIGQARTMLYHRVYLHQTTRNSERVLAKALQKIASQDSTGALSDALKLWGIDDHALVDKLAEHPVAGVWGQRLKTRQLPKRASVFGRSFARMCIPIENVFPDMLAEVRKTLSKQIIGTALERLRTNPLSGQAQRELEEEITREATSLAELLRKTNSTVPSGSPEIVSVLPMPNVEANRSDCIVLENDQLSSTAASSVSDEQMEATDIIKSTGYVLTDAAWKEIVFLASRVVLYRFEMPPAKITLKPYADTEVEVSTRRRLLLDQDAVLSRIRMDHEKLGRVSRAAASAGYFDNYPRLAPLEVDENQIGKIFSKLKAFNGQGGWVVTKPSLRSFLEQFPVKLRRPMAELLCSIEIFDRVELVKNIKDGIIGISKGDTEGFIVGLSPDSGSSVRMQLEQELSASLGTSRWHFKKSIRDAFQSAKSGDHLVFCDDNVTSGSQALCQFLAWLGVPETSWTEAQRLEKGIERTALSDRDAELLRNLKVTIVTAAGTTDAVTLLKEELPKLGLKDYQGLVFGKTLSHAAANLDVLEPFLKQVGTSLIAWCRYDSEDVSKLSQGQQDACQEDALGYRGARGLYCTPFNVPVGTLTALWAPGIHSGEPWMPLMIRRGYLSKLVLA